jgi:serine/threonine protein kinase/tetratricopeptide (TPR) repeat protein
MSSATTIDEELVRRLPLPLAQLYRRAYNARTAQDRHHSAYFLWEAAVKLLAMTALVEHAHSEANPGVEERLAALARPSAGQWWEFVRLLVPLLAEREDAGFRAVRDLVLGRSRDDLARTAQLDADLRGALKAGSTPRSEVRLGELFDRLVQYRNTVIGHGGQRPEAFYEQQARSLRAGLGELLRHWDVLAGRRLVYAEDVRRLPAGGWLLERFTLAGEVAGRLEPLEVAGPEPAQLPRPGRLYLEPLAAGRLALYPLHPLLLFDPELQDVWFYNGHRGNRRDGRRTGYLCYIKGDQEREEPCDEQPSRLAGLLQLPAGESAAAGSTTEPAAGGHHVGEFELLSILGRGSMGVVYRAWQPSLGRQVALKRAVRGTPRADDRFAREVRALGRVDHPHLARIFLSGLDGEHRYYAMELIEGAPLSAVLDRLRASGTAASAVELRTWQQTLSTIFEQVRQAEEPLGPVGAEGPAPRPPMLTDEGRRPGHSILPPAGGNSYIGQMVELVRQVAGAAQALHEAGVVHRDVKPGNIMVTAGGQQAVLVDLGVAQMAGDGPLTETRQFVGTLRYASPEQVLAVDRVDGRSDVYSLGAVLWELLTLQPLYGATDSTPSPELMQRIQYAEPERIRRFNPSVPADLEAIVLQCLEKDRARRYPSAAALAEDLGHWQAGVPVLAHPQTLRYLLGKYARRHRRRLAVVAILLVLALSGGGLSWYHVAEARAEAERQRIETDRQRALAHESFTQARLAAEQMIRLSRDRLLDRPGMEPLRKRLLEGALDRYRGIAERYGGDPAVRIGLADAYHFLGEAARELGQFAAALTAFREEEGLRETFVAEAPSDRGVRLALARAHAAVGSALWWLQREGALASYEQARKELEELVGEDPAERTARFYLAKVLDDLGSILLERGRMEEARKALEQARDYRQALVQEEPANLEYQYDLAGSWINLGQLAAARKQPDQERRAYEEAGRILERLVAQHGQARRYQEALALVYGNLGDSERARGRSGEAVTLQEKTLAIRRRLSDAEPDNNRLRYYLAVAHNDLGEARRNDRQLTAALESYEAGQRIAEELVAAQANNLDFRRLLSILLFNRGETLETLDRRTEAIPFLRQAVEHVRQLAEKAPGVPDYQQALTRYRAALARVDSAKR